MTFAEWKDDTVQRVREDGINGITESVYELYVGGWRRLGLLYNYGTPIYEKDWDVLVVMDACRADLMDEVVDDYQWIETSGSVYSLASTSPEWMEKNFVASYSEEMAKTAYVNGNPWSQEILAPNDFSLLDEVWKYSWDDDLKTILPEALTDRAIRVHREKRPDRMIVHYMQPHHPYVRDPLSDGLHLEYLGQEHNSVWRMLREGDVTFEDHWSRYRDNLRYVLDHIAVLRRNIDAETVVLTADHGNLFGEFGLYGHIRYVPVPALKKVPWALTSAEDTGEYEPTLEPEDASPDVKRRLEDLGYT